MRIGRDFLRRARVRWGDAVSWWLLVAAIVVPSGIFVASTLSAAREAAERHAAITARNLARLLASDVGGTIATVDVVLRAVARDVEERLAAGDIDAATLDAMVARQQALAPVILAIGVTDAAGSYRFGTAVRESPPAPIAERDYFTRLRDADHAILAIGQPVEARISKQWVMPMGRRLVDRAGRFAGVVYTGLPLDYLAKEFTGVDSGTNGFVSLFDDRRAIIARWPEAIGGRAAAGMTPTSPAILAAWAEGRGEANYRGRSSLDGLARSYAYTRVGELPLYANVGLAEDDFLAAWRQQSLVALALYAAFVAVVIAAAILLRRSWRALAAANLRLGGLNDELQQFAYAASHDMREPLRMISSYLGLLERRMGDVLTDDGREFLGFAKDGAQRLDRMILGLLDYSRIGRGDEARLPVPLAEALNDALASLAVVVEGSGAEVRVDKHLPTVAGVRSELIRLFQNLIGNAIKYTAPGRPPVVTVTAKAERGAWRVSIADNGVGIPAEAHERIFGIFQRLHGAEIEGCGIGLANCRKIVERHGGRIWVESTAGEGATFHFTLPMAG